MLERLLITLLIGLVAVIAYRLLQAYQRQRVATVTQTTAQPNQAKLLYFRSEHCGACHAQARYLEALEAPYQPLIEAIDVEKEAHVARSYQILTLPTTILIDQNGTVQHINYGLTNPSKLTQQLEQFGIGPAIKNSP